MKPITAPLTRHAEKRSVDRNLPEIARWLLLEFGNEAPDRKQQGCTSFSFDKRAWRELERFFGAWRLKEMSQLRNAYMVVSAEGEIVTLAYRK